MPKVTIALDAMGGDHGPTVVIPAAVRLFQQHADVFLIFVGQEAVLRPLLEQHVAQWSARWRLQTASEVVAMDESPAFALRSKKDSSMRVAINLVKVGEADACVSAGNTGALMATARFVLKTLPGVDRPAIVTGFPTTTGKETRVLDVGANVDSLPEHLYQFAVMASILVSAMEQIEQPRVGLLNIGQEDIKGNELVKKTALLLQAHAELNYVGYVEADALFKGVADVVVCDGFVGNVALKAVEGVLKFFRTVAKEICTETWWMKLIALPAIFVLKRVMRRLDPDRHNGAVLLGLNGIVIKSHGGAGVNAFSYAIEEAVSQARYNVPSRIKTEVARWLQVPATEEA